jgi:hypothetical protein
MPIPSRRAVARDAVLLLAIVGWAAGLGAQPAAPPAVSVRFELNDAQVKGRALEGVAISVAPAAGGAAVASGRTGSDGRWTARLSPGTYPVSYRLDGYVPYTSGATEIREDGQLVTVSLSRLLEATESGGREVRIILNWGSRPDQVRDADSHLACPCGASDRHVYYQARVHQAAEHRVELDVDDTDWGGPETITLTRPAPGHFPLLRTRGRLRLSAGRGHGSPDPGRMSQRGGSASLRGTSQCASRISKRRCSSRLNVSWSG